MESNRTPPLAEYQDLVSRGGAGGKQPRIPPIVRWRRMCAERKKVTRALLINRWFGGRSVHSDRFIRYSDARSAASFQLTKSLSIMPLPCRS